ncbi:hypothetical protein SRHO_G00181560 [Serrasalmus rhombeus]
MLVSGWTEGSMLSKCEMKSRLAAAFEALKSGAANDDLAKLVCTVEAISKFNTSLVTIIDLSIPGLLIRHGFPIDRLPTEEVIGDYFPKMFPKETLVTDNPFSSPEVVMEDDGTSLIPKGMFSTQATKELSILPETVTEDFIPASREPEEGLANTSTQDNNPSEGNPTDSVDRQGWDHREKVEIDEISTREGSDSPVDSREFLSDPHRQDLDLGDRPYNSRYGLSPDDGSYDPSQYSRVLYGIFQLSDDVACQSGSKYSRNLCKLDCKDLINDDISDDIECLMTLKEQLAEMTFTEERCHVVEPSGYFETCD